MLPAGERSFVEDMRNFDFPESRSLKLKEVMGYDKHRLVDQGVCVSDLAVFGLEYLFKAGLLDKDGFEGLILVTQSPDHFMPATSNIIQGRLGLKRDLFCMDINQGCAGFVIGLIQAFLMLDQPSIQRVVLINADVLSRKVSPKDRNSYPLIGDGASITIVEKTDVDCAIYADVKMDGSGSDVLIIPAGGFRTPSTPETGILEDAGENNLRAKDHLRMNGSAVFNFVQLEIPPLIEEVMRTACVTDDDIDYYICHQPNRFMLQKLADKLRISHSKVPMNIVENFGNSSGVTIPTAIAFNLASALTSGVCKVCLAGFGVGLTWGAMILDIGNLNFCSMVDYPSLPAPAE